MHIDIKKFATMSAITVQEDQKHDIEKGILDILSYVSIIENASGLSHVQYDQRKDNIFRSQEFLGLSEARDNKKKIIFSNAPLLSENYFTVPALIVRKS
jgi:Asp-tRNA(Asn)/Glu-tRNA(Gln) amidotransferase C subunit